ncbi:hypothetical protein K8I61_14050 [bacterium]|nr:hypothetical protein [bacterium]
MSVERSDDQRFDSRLVLRFVERGWVTEKDYTRWLKDLPDAAGNADFVTAAIFEEKPARSVSSDDDDDEIDEDDEEADEDEEDD